MNTEKLSDIFHLSSYEAQVYTAAVQLGIASLTELSRATGIARTAVYTPVQGLLDRGMLSIVTVKKRHHYRAIDPEQLRYIYDQKKVDLEQVIAELTKSIAIPENQLEIRYFPGINGIVTASNIFLEETTSKYICSFDNPTHLPKIARLYQLDDQIDRRVAKRIHLRMISSVPKLQAWMEDYIARNKKELRETVLISPRLFPFSSTIIIDDDRVMIIDMRNKPFAILIDNEGLAMTLRSIHALIWEQYRLTGK